MSEECGHLRFVKTWGSASCQNVYFRAWSSTEHLGGGPETHLGRIYQRVSSGIRLKDNALMNGGRSGFQVFGLLFSGTLRRWFLVWWSLPIPQWFSGGPLRNHARKWILNFFFWIYSTSNIWSIVINWDSSLSPWANLIENWAGMVGHLVALYEIEQNDKEKGKNGIGMMAI